MNTSFPRFALFACLLFIHEPASGLDERPRPHMHRWIPGPKRFSRHDRPTQSLRLASGSASSIDSLQDWAREVSTGLVRSNDQAYAVITDPSTGNVYVTGSAESDYLTIKYNAAGDTLWTARYHAASDATPTAIALDSSGNVFVTGISEDDFVTLKYSASGSRLWLARYNGPGNLDDQPVALAVDKSGYAYVTGFSYGGNSGYDFATVKYSPAGAQVWAARLNGTGNDDDEPRGIAVDASGSVFVTGFVTNTEFTRDYVTAKYSSAGALLWSAVYDGPGHDDDQATGIALDASGAVFVTGISLNESFSYDYATIKYSSTGTRQWVSRFDGDAGLDDEAAAITTDIAGNVIVTGTSTDATNALNLVTRAYTTAGVFLWNATYTGPAHTLSFPTTLALDQTGNVYVGAESDEPGQPAKFLTAKYSSSGTPLWTTLTTEPNKSRILTAMWIDRAGTAYCTGFVADTGATEDYLTVRIDSLGNPQWSKRYDGPNHSEEFAQAIATDLSGNVYIAGLSNSSTTGGDFLTVKYNSAGTQQWAVRYNGPANGFDDPTAIAVDFLGNVYVTGTSEGSGTLADYATVKYNSSGIQQWVMRYNGPANLADHPRSLTIDFSGNIIVTGTSASSAITATFATVKYSPGGSQLWATRSAIARHAGAVAVSADHAGAVYVTGWMDDSLLNTNVVTLKLDPAGNQRWMFSYNGPANGVDKPSSLTLDRAANVYVAGFSEGSGTQDDFLILKYDSAGARQWVTGFNGTGNANDHAVAAVSDSSQNVTVTGFSRNSLGNDDIVTLKLDSLGARLWLSVYDGQGHQGDFPSGMVSDLSGNLYVSGYGDDPGGTPGFITVKYDPLGQLLWSQRFTSNASSAVAQALAIDTSRNLAISGTLVRDVLSSVSTTVHYHATHAVFSVPTHSVAFGNKDITCGPAWFSLAVTNSGNENLYVNSTASDDTNFTVSPAQAMIPPGNSGNFVLSFIPRTIGPQSGHIVFSHGASPGHDTINVSGTGTGTGSEVTLAIHYGTGWQMISLPVRQACPNVLSNVFEFRGSYLRKDTVYNAKGYWKKLAVPNLAFIGYSDAAETLALNQGWNMIGSISSTVPIGTLSFSPPGIRSSPYYGYSNAYFFSDSLVPGHSYWVKSRQTGSMIIRKSAFSEKPQGLPAASTFTVTDAKGFAQELRLLETPIDDPDYYDLPPGPPGDFFDVRFASNRLVESAFQRGEFPIKISGASYPARFGWSVQSQKLSLRIGRRDVVMSGEGSVVLDEPADLEILSGKSSRLPAEFALHQNFPNPFNPSTTIRYDLPEFSRVTLTLFDLLGRKLRTLVDEFQDPGFKSFELNAAALASGVYYYRLDAVSVASSHCTSLSRRLMLLK